MAFISNGGGGTSGGSVGSGLKAVAKTLPRAPAPRPPAPGPPILPVVPHQALASSQGYAQKSAAASYSPPAAARFSPAGIPPAPSPAAVFGSRQASMQGLIRAIAKGTGTKAPSLKQPDQHLWDVNPLSVGGWTLGRVDQGIDANAAPGSPILAPNDAKVTHIDPNWFQGQPQVTLQLTKGPNAGKYIFLAEQITNIPQVGQTIKRGQPIARYAPSGTGIEIGLAANAQGTTLARATTGYSEGQVTPAGQQFVSTFIKKGVKPGSAPSGAPPSSGSNRVSVINGAPLSTSQRVFAAELVKKTGLDPGVVAAWVHSEQPPTGLAPNGPHNWLNIGATDSGFMGSGNPAWQNPTTAADFTAKWLRGTSAPGFGPASPGVRTILQSAGSSPANQVATIQHSGWASSGYPALAQSYNAIAGTAKLGTANVPASAFAGGSAPAGSSGGAAPAQASGGATVAGFPVQNQQQANAAQMTANIAGMGPFPTGGSTVQQRRMKLLDSFLQGQAGGGNPFNAIGKSSGAGAFALPGSVGSLALSSLQQLAGSTKLKIPGF